MINKSFMENLKESNSSVSELVDSTIDSAIESISKNLLEYRIAMLEALASHSDTSFTKNIASDKKSLEILEQGQKVEIEPTFSDEATEENSYCALLVDRKLLESANVILEGTRKDDPFLGLAIIHAVRVVFSNFTVERTFP